MQAGVGTGRGGHGNEWHWDAHLKWGRGSLAHWLISDQAVVHHQSTASHGKTNQLFGMNSPEISHLIISVKATFVVVLDDNPPLTLFQLRHDLDQLWVIVRLLLICCHPSLVICDCWKKVWFWHSTTSAHSCPSI